MHNDRLIWLIAAILFVWAIGYVASEVYSAAFMATAETLQNAGPGANLLFSADYSGASAVITRHESSDLTLGITDLVTSVAVQGTKAAGAADVQVDLLNSSGCILDTATVAMATTAGAYNTTVTMAGTVAYRDVATAKAVYTASAPAAGVIFDGVASGNGQRRQLDQLASHRRGWWCQSSPSSRYIHA